MNKLLGLGLGCHVNSLLRGHIFHIPLGQPGGCQSQAQWKLACASQAEWANGSRSKEGVARHKCHRVCKINYHWPLFHNFLSFYHPLHLCFALELMRTVQEGRLHRFSNWGMKLLLTVLKHVHKLTVYTESPEPSWLPCQQQHISCQRWGSNHRLWPRAGAETQVTWANICALLRGRNSDNTISTG